jgi:hypothetical protein
MDDPFQGLGPKPLSRFRIIGFVVLAFVIAGFYLYTTPDSIARAYITGKCFKRPLPDQCILPSQRVVVPPYLLNGPAPK